MNKLINLIKSQINEIGEANLPVYQYKLFYKTKNNYIYTFDTEDNDKYKISFDFDDFAWDISFVAKGKSDIEINKGRLYRVMSTITDIVKRFVSVKNPLILLFYGSKTKGNNDTRRNNLYTKYIGEHIGNNYQLIQYGSLFYIIRKIDNEFKTEFAELSDKFKRELLEIIPDLIDKIDINVINNIDSYNKSILIINNPNLINKIDTANIDPDDIDMILQHKPELKQIIKEEINMIINDDTMYEDDNSIGYIDTNQTLPSEKINEELIVKPEMPNTLSFYHGGNLDRYEPSLAQKKGRYEYGAGLYLTTHYQTAAKYAKGSRKMYLVTVEKGTDVNNAFINLDRAKEFINKYAVASMRKELIKILDSYTNDTTIKAYIFNNILNNYKAIKPSNTNNVRDFFIENNIDYEIVSNPFGWGEEMMVLYNMKKIVKSIIIKPTDEIKDYMIKN